MTDVPIANVGVVIAYVGEAGVDQSGEAFKHGNLVKKGQKGVWVDPLDPGKYPINPHTHKVINVPTANVVLNWGTPLSFVLQAAPAANGTYTNVPNPTSPYTNAINGSNLFFRTVPAN